jgi:REP element-mobilizing transposase RayT
MSGKYKAFDPEMPYFVTFSLVEWMPLFRSFRYADIVVNSIRYCMDNKGLELFGYCVMYTHLHMIIRGVEKGPGPVLRDMKKFTSSEIIRSLYIYNDDENFYMIEVFKKAAAFNSRNKYQKVWQDGYHPEIIYSNKFFFQKLNYIHQNPVRAGIVDLPEDYYYSSARNYAELSAPLEIIIQSTELISF